MHRCDVLYIPKSVLCADRNGECSVRVRQDTAAWGAIRTHVAAWGRIMVHASLCGSCQVTSQNDKTSTIARQAAQDMTAHLQSRGQRPS
eukprot:365466-Chlamydomonas_euryale.AAC.11